MGTGPPTDADRLLARLNALKPSSVTLEDTPHLHDATTNNDARETPDDLIARFQDLYGRDKSSDLPAERRSSAGSDKDPLPSPTIEELLAELESNDSLRVNEADQQEARDLIVEAKLVMPLDKDHLKDSGTKNGETLPDPSQTSSKENYNEDAEAQAALQRLLDEAELEPEGGDATMTVPMESSGSRERTREQPLHSFAALQFPSVPEDDNDTLNLPSAPTAAPSRSGKTKPKPAGISDEEINTWCVICCNDASVQCFGCDKDLYCWGCWREGHTGESAGPEERHHVWERYRKPCKQ